MFSSSSFIHVCMRTSEISPQLKLSRLKLRNSNFQSWNTLFRVIMKIQFCKRALIYSELQRTFLCAIWVVYINEVDWSHNKNHIQNNTEQNLYSYCSLRMNPKTDRDANRWELHRWVHHLQFLFSLNIHNFNLLRRIKKYFN